MLTTMRNRLGPVFVTLIIGGIAGVFVLSDFISPRRGGGLGGGGTSIAGEVNGEPVSMGEFNRSLSQRIESMKQMTGGKLTDEQIRMFRMRETVFNELAQRKLILQDCAKSGLLPSDAEVMNKIRELPYFQKEGRFDLTTYRNILAANNLNPGAFEKMMRDDLTLQLWMDGVKSRVQVSADELEREYQVSNDKRNIKFVLLDSETGRKAIPVASTEIEEFLKDPSKLARAKARFESVKSTQHKGKKFEEVQKELVRDVIAGEKTEAIRDANLKLADQVMPLLGRAPDSQVNSLLKSVGTTVKTSGLITRQAPFIQGLGEAKDLLSDAFAAESPIVLTQGGKAKKYTSAAWVAVAVVSESKKPEMNKFEGEKSKLEQQLRFKKERTLEQEWIQQLRSKAKIEMNPALVEAERSS